MHEKNLYQVSNPDDTVFVDLVDMVKSLAGVPNTRNWEQKVPDNCRSLISTSTKTWEWDGLLFTQKNLTRKTEVFQYLWDCAIQAARVSHSTAQSIERNFPRVEPVNTAGSVDFDLMNKARWNPKNSHSRKFFDLSSYEFEMLIYFQQRSAGNMQQSRSSTSLKRARMV
jgi:hypothetical protein